MKHKSRREFLKTSGRLAGGVFLSSQIHAAFARDGQFARAAGNDNKFLLYIHCGSWDGIASGLIQPQSTSSWPSGVFENGIVTESPNPLLMNLTADRGMIFTPYNRVLSEISGNLFHATINPRSLDHNVARLLQVSGHGTIHPSWSAGFAQLTRNPDRGPGFIVGPLSLGKSNSFTADVAQVNAGSVSGFAATFKDPVASGLTQEIRGGFGSVAQSIYRERFGTSIVPGRFASTFEGSHKYWTQGLPELDPSTDLMKGLSAALSVENANASIDMYLGNNDGQGVKERYGNFGALRTKLILAGALAKTGLACGMDISLPGEDLHFGGSQVQTARSGAQLWVQLTLFWKWIIQQGLQDQVMVVVSHEFSRSRFNSSIKKETMTVGGVSKEINCPGTDHGLTAGMYILNGKMPGGERTGGVLSSYVPAGSATLGGPPKESIPAPSSLGVVSTALMVCYPEIFKNPREPLSTRNLRAVFPAIEDKDVIQPLLEASK